MATAVRILKSPPGGRRYRTGETVILPDPVAAKLVATGCGEPTGRAASPLFSAMVDCFRNATPKRAAAPLPKINVRLKAAATVGGQLRNAGALVAVDEGRAAMLVARGMADIPSGVSPRFADKVADSRRFDAFLTARGSGLQLGTMLL